MSTSAHSHSPNSTTSFEFLGLYTPESARSGLTADAVAANMASDSQIKRDYGSKRSRKTLLGATGETDHGQYDNKNADGRQKANLYNLE